MSNAADVRVKPIKIMLDKERNILFDMNAFAELEEKFGDIEKALEALGKGSLKNIRLILWAGLIHEDEDLKEKDVFRTVPISSLEEISKLVTEAIMAGLPQDIAKNVQEAAQPTE
jgi:hypothetical protein